MSISTGKNLDVLSLTSNEGMDHKYKMQSRMVNKDNNAFDTILKNAVSSSSIMDKEQIRMLLFAMRIQMNERLFQVMADEKKDGDSNNPLYGLMNMNITGYLPEPSASKIQHKPQKNDDILRMPKGEIDGIINHAADMFSVDPDLIRGVIKAESNFNAQSTSPKGAMGLMQLMPATARDLGVKNPYDPYENIMGGTRYLKDLLNRYDGNVDRALAAYNWGMGNVEKHPGRLPSETRTYISRIKQYYFETKA